MTPNKIPYDILTDPESETAEAVLFTARCALVIGVEVGLGSEPVQRDQAMTTIREMERGLRASQSNLAWRTREGLA